MGICDHNPTTTGFIIAAFLIGILFFGQCASAAVNPGLSENITNLPVPGNPALQPPVPVNVSDLYDENVTGAGIAPNMAPVNPDLLQYLQDHQEKQKIQTLPSESGETTVDQRHGLGYIPPPFSMSHLKGPFVTQDTGSSTTSLLAGPTAGAPPSSYDLRTMGKLTPVKNQLTSGTCWAFAAYGTLESYLLPGETWDLSENNLKNLLSINYPEGYDRGSEDGGNDFKSTAYLARWSGPISEEDDPFNPSSYLSPTDKSVRKHIQNVYFIPDRTGSTDNTNIQNAILTYGGVTTLMRWEGSTGNSSSYWNNSSNSYYYMGSDDINHEVTIVGWDDSFDKSKFSTVPPGNGAFIVKNSWGSVWGDNGFFYISYYDTNVGKTNTLFTAESPANYNHIYQYDPLGMVAQYYFSGTPRTGWMANVFTSSRTETLSAVSFYTTDTNTAYQVNVYKNPNSGPVLNGSGVAGTSSGTFGNAGYHTVPVSPGIPLASGDTFSVAVKLTNPSYAYWAATEYYNTSAIFKSSKATASAGQSFYSIGGTSWTDLTTVLPKSNFCIKAFTNDTGNSTTKTGVFRSPGIWILDYNGNFGWDGTPADKVYTFGGIGNTSVYGDWDGNNKSEVGAYNNGTWYLDYNGNGIYDGPVVDRTAGFGSAGYKPVVGDWDGNGKDNIGVELDGIWAIDYNGNYVWDGATTDRFAALGQTNDIPVIGDWDGNGKDKIGSHKDGFWAIDYNGNYLWDGAVTDRFAGFGQIADKPVIGDWNGDGTDKIGMEINGFWATDYNGNYVWEGAVTDRFAGFGSTGDAPVVGDWNGNGKTKIGSFKDGFWAIDYDGSYVWNGAIIDRFAGFGQSGDIPVVGKWS